MKTTHGHSANGSVSPTYASWMYMKKRCLNKNATGWKYYGARGVKICDRWLKFENFLADMGEKPEGTSIDRIDPRGDYEPENCRWATQAQQTRNRSCVKLDQRKVHHIRWLVEMGYSIARVASMYGVNRCTVGDIIHGRSWI